MEDGEIVQSRHHYLKAKRAAFYFFMFNPFDFLYLIIPHFYFLTHLSPLIIHHFFVHLLDLFYHTAMLKLPLFILLCLLYASNACAQDVNDWVENYEIHDEITNIEREEENSEDPVLAELQAHPLNLNTATREDLERIPFLTPRQIEDICDYLYHYAPMKTTAELALITSIDFSTRRLLERFVYVDERQEPHFPSLNRLLEFGKHEVVAMLKVPFYTRKGDRKGFLGYGLKHWIRYDFHYSDYLRAGFVGSQDAGEPFFAHRNKWGYDYYSAYLLMRKMGCLKALAVGRYRVRLGMGLVINNDYGFGKQMMLGALGRTASQIRAHSSRSEGNYLQGTAATVSLSKGIELTGFVSYRYVDATLTPDNKAVRTLLTTGYHRTQAEMNKKHNVGEWLSGGHINWFYQGIHFGVTGLYAELDKPLQPDFGKIYRRYDAQGCRFYHFSADYGYINAKLTLNGETATDRNGALATINTASWQLNSRLSFTVLQRFYSYKYVSLFARSFSDAGRVHNESGVYVGARWSPFGRLLLTAYADYAYFPHPRYRCSAPSRSSDYLLSAAYTAQKITLSGRYRLRLRQQDAAKGGPLIDRTEHRGRLSVGYASPFGYAALRADAAYSLSTKHSWGWMLTANGGYTHHQVAFSGNIGYFHTTDFGSRLYIYERDMRYHFTFPAFFGQGIRAALLLRGDMGKHLRLMGKLASTKYFDRNKIGSSYNQIAQSVQTDMSLQMIWKF